MTTIHGFCRRLLGTHPIAAGLDPRFRVLDDAEAGRLRERAAREAIDALVAGGDEQVARVTASLPGIPRERHRAHGPRAPAQPGHGPAEPAGGRPAGTTLARAEKTRR